MRPEVVHLQIESTNDFSDFPILYLAFHGKELTIQIGDTFHDLDQLSELLENKCAGRVIVIGSCSVLNVDKRHIKRFLEKTGAFAVCGYKSDVDWMRSTAFELLLLSALQNNKFDGRGLNAIEVKLNELSKCFKDLKFRFISKFE